jgi:hypothetical protein
MIRLTHGSRAMIGCVAAVLAALAVLPASAQIAIAKGDIDADAPAASEEEAAAPMTKGEVRLAKLLEGRVAGEPTRCIRAFPSQRMTTIEGTAYVYGSGNTIWVQRTRNPEAISDTDTLVINRYSGLQLCSLDFARTIDRYNGFFTGAVFFEDFVPYSRIKPGAAGEG